jgi:hypothetical protein
MPDMGQKECIGGAQTNNYQEQFTESIRCRVPAADHELSAIAFSFGSGNL